MFAVSFLVRAPAAAQALRVGALVPILCGYFVSVNIRFGDKYGLWPGSKNAAPERPRTWRRIAAEYAYMFGVGILGIAVVLWLAR